MNGAEIIKSGDGERSRHLVPFPAVELATVRFWSFPTPLFHEERNHCSGADVADVSHPGLFHRPGFWAALTADD